MKILLILANQPYNGSDNAHNALRLADNLHKKGEEVRIFLMNDAVDLVRDSTEKPGDYDIDLVAKLKELYRGGVALKVCGSCQSRYGLHAGEPYFSDEIKGSMDILATWVCECDRTLTF